MINCDTPFPSFPAGSKKIPLSRERAREAQSKAKRKRKRKGLQSLIIIVQYLLLKHMMYILGRPMYSKVGGGRVVKWGPGTNDPSLREASHVDWNARRCPCYGSARCLMFYNIDISKVSTQMCFVELFLW